MHVGVVYWDRDSGIVEETAFILSALGHDVTRLAWDGVVSAELDVIFMSGPFGSIVPLGKQLAAISAEKRPKLIWNITEQLPNPNIPKPLTKLTASIRSRVERWGYHHANNIWQQRLGTRFVSNKANRLRYLGDMRWLQSAGILTLITTGSPWKAQYMRQFGIEPFVTPAPAYYPRWGTLLNLERDIPVLWLGKIATKRRRNALEKLRAELGRRDIEMHMIDGEHNPYVFGEERTKLINRSRIMVNILRTEWDNHAMRFGLATVNGAMIISEPTFPHTSFVPGEHYVEVALDNMADTIVYYLNNEGTRQTIAARAYERIRANSRENTLRLIIEQL